MQDFGFEPLASSCLVLPRLASNAENTFLKEASGLCEIGQFAGFVFSG